MLASLHIQNVALIEDIEISFGANLNVITGETGAGKSIMLDALKFVLGDRLDKSMLREGTEFMKVDAFFTGIKDASATKIFEVSGIKIVDGELLVSREYNIIGKTSVRINGELSTGAVLKKITSYLIDVHGQHEHQAILDNDFQLEILDSYARSELMEPLENLNKLIDEINEIDKSLKVFGGNINEKQNLIDLYRYQKKEIEDANVGANELGDLEAKLKEMKSSEKIAQNLNETLMALDKNPYGESALEQIGQAEKLLGQLSTIGEKFENIRTRLNSVYIEVEDIISTSNELLFATQFDEKEFERIDNRIDYIKTIFRKYGGNYEALSEYYDKTCEKLKLLENGEEEFNRLTAKKEKIVEKVKILQDEISEIRKRNAKSMQEKIEKEIKELGMPNAQFSIDFSKIPDEYSRKGQDMVEFMFTANLGFEKRPLNKVASGGELSRFMLAYKIVVNNLDNIDTLIFDEIDTGISGNIAMVVAKCMGRLSRIKQLVVITHLPQICAMGDTNFYVEKSGDVVTKSNVTMIKDEMLTKEIARLMGLMDEKGLDFARELKLQAETYKNNLS